MKIILFQSLDVWGFFPNFFHSFLQLIHSCWLKSTVVHEKIIFCRLKVSMNSVYGNAKVFHCCSNLSVNTVTTIKFFAHTVACQPFFKCLHFRSSEIMNKFV